ncbi:MAG: DUF2070 family protein [Candidatus Anstonellaceae archaeon]
MQEVKKEALAVTKYFLSLPHPAKTLLAILATSLLFGILLSTFHDNDAIRILAGGLNGVVFLGFPSVFSSLMLYLLRRKATFRRAIFLGFISCALYGVFYLLSVALSGLLPPAENLIYVGFGLVFVLWYFLLKLAFGFHKSAFLLATMQLVIFAAFYSIGGALEEEEDVVGLVAKLYLAVFVFLAAIYLMFYFLSLPMKKNLKISSMDAISMFLSQWLYGEKELEEVFEEIGEEAETFVWVGEFRGKQNRTFFVVPYIHFGPFGNLGGSELTCMIANSLPGNSNVFVFHGTVTHDFNPVSSKEAQKVIFACKKAIEKIKLEPAKFAYSECRVGSTKASAYLINDSAFITYSRAPYTTEDINFGIGLAAVQIAKSKYKSVAVVDEHNAETGDISSVEVGNPIGFEILDATSAIFQRPHKKSSFFFGSATAIARFENIGKNGIKLALFKTSEKLYAVLLIDANGIVPEFRSQLVDLLCALGKEKGLQCVGEVMTTDTHQINTVQGVLNPVGTKHKGDLMMLVRSLFMEAFSLLEEVKFGSAEQRFKIEVFGSGQSTEIASTINGVIAILRLILPAILLGSVAFLVWALSKL